MGILNTPASAEIAPYAPSSHFALSGLVQEARHVYSQWVALDEVQTFSKDAAECRHVEAHYRSLYDRHEALCNVIASSLAASPFEALAQMTWIVTAVKDALEFPEEQKSDDRRRLELAMESLTRFLEGHFSIAREDATPYFNDADKDDIRKPHQALKTD